MTWEAIPPNVRTIAREILTADEYDAVRLAAHGYGYRRIATITATSRDTARNRVQRGLRKLQTELQSKGIDEQALRQTETR